MAQEKTIELLSRIEAIDKERLTLLEELKNNFPVKVEEKVEIVDTETDAHIRFVFITDIRVELVGKDNKARMHFELQKCKKDGTKSSQQDFLRFNEILKKIK